MTTLLTAPEALEVDGRQLPVIAVPWEQFLAFMGDCWEPGQHICNIGPTGEGKSTVNVGLLDTRRYVLALDPKGEDETLEASGWVAPTLEARPIDRLAEPPHRRTFWGGCHRVRSGLSRLHHRADLRADATPDVPAMQGHRL